jgi:hypothetical protein
MQMSVSDLLLCLITNKPYFCVPRTMFSTLNLLKTSALPSLRAKFFFPDNCLLILHGVVLYFVQGTSKWRYTSLSTRTTLLLRLS